MILEKKPSTSVWFIKQEKKFMVIEMMVIDVGTEKACKRKTNHIKATCSFSLNKKKERKHADVCSLMWIDFKTLLFALTQEAERCVRGV